MPLHTLIKLSFSVFGDNFFPILVEDRITKTLDGEILFSPDEIRDVNPIGEVYGYGCMIFMHPKIFGMGTGIREYEECFVKFIEDNYDTFIKYGAEYFHLDIEVCDWCDNTNFEIFNKDLLKRIYKFDNISLPISVYRISEEQIKEYIISTGNEEYLN